MPNDWFQFKQFLIRQDSCAMKVGTDGVLLGAWANVDQVNSVLDVGTGTGLITLILAQRTKARIDGIELDEAAARQAKQNCQASPWSQRIRIVWGDFLSDEAAIQPPYDLIISNPPFFTKGMAPTDQQRRIARHQDQLPLDQLIARSILFLAPSGRICLILPQDLFDQAALFFKSAGFSLLRKLLVSGKPNGGLKRIAAEWGRENGNTQVDSLAINSELSNGYSSEYSQLTKAFYLDRD